MTDPPLFDALRKSIADEDSVPPYVIFHDKTLIEMVSVQPTLLSEMAMISGVGEKKLEKLEKNRKSFWQLLESISNLAIKLIKIVR